MIKFFEKVLNIFFPKELKCIFCGRDVADFENTPYCPSCEKEGFFNNSKHRCLTCDMGFVGKGEYCEHCKKEHKSFDRATCPFIYEGAVRSTILKLKSDNAKYLAKPMGKLMAKRLTEENFKFDVIVPVPLSEKSLKKRGYNQAELLATEIGKELNIPVLKDILIKAKDTKHQKELGFSDRQKNLLGAFHLQSYKEIKGKSILLVDDILTTCATVNACAKLLQKHADEVLVCAFARRTLRTDTGNS